MTQSKNTPGPWKDIFSDVNHHICVSLSDDIGDFEIASKNDICKMIAATELLMEIEYLAEMYSKATGFPIPSSVARVIAKAKGQ